MKNVFISFNYSMLMSSCGNGNKKELFRFVCFFCCYLYKHTKCIVSIYLYTQQANAFIRSNLNRKFSVKGFHTIYGWGVEVEPLLGLF